MRERDFGSSRSGEIEQALPFPRSVRRPSERLPMPSPGGHHCIVYVPVGKIVGACTGPDGRSSRAFYVEVGPGGEGGEFAHMPPHVCFRCRSCVCSQGLQIAHREVDSKGRRHSASIQAQREALETTAG